MFIFQHFYVFRHSIILLLTKSQLIYSKRDCIQPNKKNRFSEEKKSRFYILYTTSTIWREYKHSRMNWFVQFSPGISIASIDCHRTKNPITSICRHTSSANIFSRDKSDQFFHSFIVMQIRFYIQTISTPYTYDVVIFGIEK